MKKQFYYLAGLFLLGTVNASAQTKIKDGTVTGSPSLPNLNSILELESNRRGLLLPRIALQGTAFAAPQSAHVAGMSVYNTATVNDVTPGFYYNDGTKWVRLVGSGLPTGSGNLTAGSLLTLTGTPTGASLKTAGYEVDTTALKTYVTTSINNETITGKNTTAGQLITVTNGTGASLTNMTVSADTAALKNYINTSINNETITGKNTTAGQLITVTNGTGASLTNMTVSADTAAVKTFVTNSIVNNTISGNDLTAGTLLQTTGTPTGAALKTAGYRVDTLGLKTFVTNSINNETITGKNTTAGQLITVTNGTGASLTNMTVSADTAALKNYINTSINNETITGKNTTAGQLITVTNGAGASLTNMTVSADTAAVKTFVTNSIVNNTISGNDLTAGTLLQTTGTPTGAALKTAGYRVDTLGLKTFVTNSINNETITGKNTTAGQLITVTNGTGASFTDMTVAADTTAVRNFINIGTTNTLASSVNTMTNVTNGKSATAPIVNSNALTFNTTTQELTSTVNGVASTPVTIAIPNATTADNGLTKTADNIRLGGALVAPTTVSGLTATNTMSFTGTGANAFSVDGTTLSVNATDNRVGVGTDAPTQNLHVVGNQRLTGNFYDGANNPGLSTQFLMSTGTATQWVTVPSFSNVTVIPAVFPTGSAKLNFIPFNSVNNVATGTYIDLPPGKWVVFTSLSVMSSTTSTGIIPGISNNEAYFVRVSWSETGGAGPNPQTPDLIGSTVSSGLLSGPASFAPLSGNNIIHNTSGATKRYFLIRFTTSTFGSTPTAGLRLLNFGTAHWGEDNIVAMPIN